MNPELEIIGYLGPEGTYSEHAALKFAENIKSQNLRTFLLSPCAAGSGTWGKLLWE